LARDIEFDDWRRLWQAARDASRKTECATEASKHNIGAFFLGNFGDMESDRSIGENTGNEDIFSLEYAHI
jgi:hypothetical protein